MQLLDCNLCAALLTVTNSYLKHLERRASAARRLSPDTAPLADTPATDIPPQKQQVDTQRNGTSPVATAAAQQPSDNPPQSPRLQQQTPPSTSQRGHVAPVAGSPEIAEERACINVFTADDDVESRLQPRTPAPSQADMNSLSGASGFLPSGVSRNQTLASGAQGSTQKDPSVASPHNPLVGRRLSYIRDAKGRPCKFISRSSFPASRLDAVTDVVSRINKGTWVQPRLGLSAVEPWLFWKGTRRPHQTVYIHRFP